MFPLPIDKIRHWIVSKTTHNITEELLPCSDIKVTNIWTVSFPKFISESPLRTIDINKDSIDDVIYGFGTAVDNSLHRDIYCPMFFDVTAPCEGGVMAINGLNGEVLWRRFLQHSVYGLVCSHDVNGDNIEDCLVSGKGGVRILLIILYFLKDKIWKFQIFCMLNSVDGNIIWQFQDKDKPDNLVMDIYSTGFIPDQDDDKIPDIIASHTLQNGNFNQYLKVR